MGYKYKNVKNSTTSPLLWQTPKNKLMRPARLNQKPAFDSSVPAGILRTTEIQWKAPGKTQDEHYRSVIATSGEFDLPIPGDGTAADWQKSFKKTGDIDDWKTCAPNMLAIETAWERRKHHPYMLQELAQDVARCQELEGYDSVLTLEETIEQAANAPIDVKKELEWSQGSLKWFADKIPGGAPVLMLWAKGPSAFAYGIKKKGITFPYSESEISTIAGWIGSEFMALSKLTGNVPGLLYSIGILWGEYWNKFLAASLKKYDQQVASAPPPVKTGRAIKTRTGATIYRIGQTPSKQFVRTETAPTKRASDINQRGVDFTRTLREGSARIVKREAKEFYESSERAREASINDSVKQAIAWFLACTEPGRITRIQLPIGQIELICDDVGSIDRLNSPEVATKLHTELAAALGQAPPPPTADEKGSALPWILAGLGLFAGGPLGAGAGFAIGKTMEAK